MSQELTKGQLYMLDKLRGGPEVTDCRHVSTIRILKGLNELDLVIQGNPDTDGRIIWTITEAGRESFRRGEVVACKHPPARQFSGFAKNEHMQEILWVGCCECGLVREFSSPFKPRAGARQTA